MSSDAPIVVDHVWKRYKLGSDSGIVRLAKKFAPWAVDPRVIGDFWALQDVSFEVPKGQALGVIGKNGAGKSTLLKVLCGVTRATRGSFTLKGRVAPLIEVGAGFHPELSGRENIFLNATIMGMKRSEVKKKFDEIVAFSELGSFIDSPVKHYSSGMLARLGFSVSVHVDPDVLLVDEVLSVGDLSFVLKSYRRVTEIKRRGVPVLLVSHNLQLIRNFCDRAIWLDKGKLMAEGSPNDVCAAYLKSVYDSEPDADDEAGDRYRVHSDPSVSVDAVRFLDGSGNATRNFRTGDPMVIEAEVSATRATKPLVLFVTVFQEETGHMLINHNNLEEGATTHPGFTAAGKSKIQMRLDRAPFVPGLHRVSVSLSEGDVATVADWHEKLHSFKMAGGEVGYGAFHAFPIWKNVP